MMKKISFIILILILLINFGCSIKKQIIVEEKSSESILKKFKDVDETTNFEKLRLDYAKSKDYNPYRGDNDIRDAMNSAFEKKQYKQSIGYALNILEYNYVDIEAHFICMFSYKELNEKDSEKFHSFITNGLIKSILNSGDGKSFETAYTVISVSEEHIVLNYLGYKWEQQGLCHEDGHDYDRFEVVNIETGEKDVIYFNIDIPFKWLNKKMENLLRW